MHKTKKWSFELDFVKSWGDVFNSEISASRLEISGKTFIQLVIMDITSRKKASELLNRRQEYLEKKVDEEVQKRRQNERLMMQQSKMAAMGQMMSAIAHQWRQPLNSIAIYIQDFEDAYKYNELSEEYIHDLVVQSMKQINFMSKTIDDFKNFFKPDKDEVLFEVCAETLSAISLLGVQLVRNNISLILNCHGKEVDFNESGALECSEEACTFVKGFPNEYKQVLLNLVQNARDAVVESLSDGEDGGRIVVGVEEKEETVKIYVADNGVGIPQDVAERIFEPYFTTKEEGQGTGVGLYMSKIIIEQNMKGRLYFENNNPGTKFVIEIRKQIDSA
jgi:signal transduction histidine kinase